MRNTWCRRGSVPGSESEAELEAIQVLALATQEGCWHPSSLGELTWPLETSTPTTQSFCSPFSGVLTSFGFY